MPELPKSEGSGPSGDSSPGGHPSLGESAVQEPDYVPPLQKTNSFKDWLQSLFSPDSRNAQRETLSWLTAYFFTGGAPTAQQVRDVGVTGIYIYTDERWSPDTILQLTLTDAREPTPERSLTLYAKVVRWGNDGVAFKFVLKGSKAGAHNRNSSEDFVEGVTTAEVKQFLKRIRSGSR